MLQRAFHVQQHQHKAAHDGLVAAGPERLHRQRQAEPDPVGLDRLQPEQGDPEGGQADPRSDIYALT